MPVTLADLLAATKAAFAARMDPDIRAAMLRADDLLAASGLTDRALKAGRLAPDFALPDATGRSVRLSRALADGPVVLTFYRGGWCPYCNLELRAWQTLLPELIAAGARLIAVSPESPDESLSTAEKNGLGFDVLSDVGSNVAKAYGVAFELPDELRPIYARHGHALPDRNGTEDWILPVPATYVIAPGGEVALAHVDTDYRRRLEPRDALAAVVRAARRRAA